MNMRVIKALLKKDSSLFINNRFYLLITVVGIVFYIGAYFVLPAHSNETLKMAMYAPEVPPAFSQFVDHQGIDIELFTDRTSLQQAVLDGRFQTAIALPSDIIESWARGEKPQITFYYSADAPVEMKQAVISLIEELSIAQTGQSLNFNITQEILGMDMIGQQIPLRDRLRPLLAVFILLVEIMTLASLISTEIEQGTARALLITPLRISDLFMAKGILGVGLAMAQAVLFMLIAGGFANNPLIVLVTLVLGSFMVVGAAFLLASTTRDVNAVTGWGLLVLIILAIPGFGAAIPGLLSGWAKLIPSYYLTETINRVSNYGLGWQAVWLNLVVLAVITAFLVWGGMLALRRRYQ
jgi:ABC-2 type transport system permease protein